MTSQQIFSPWTKLKLNKRFIVFPHKKNSKKVVFPLFLWTEVEPVHTPVRTQAYGPALSQSNVSILSVFCLVYNKGLYFCCSIAIFLEFYWKFDNNKIYLFISCYLTSFSH